MTTTLLLHLRDCSVECNPAGTIFAINSGMNKYGMFSKFFWSILCLILFGCADCPNVTMDGSDPKLGKIQAKFSGIYRRASSEDVHCSQELSKLTLTNGSGETFSPKINSDNNYSPFPPDQSKEIVEFLPELTTLEFSKSPLVTARAFIAYEPTHTVSSHADLLLEFFDGATGQPPLFTKNIRLHRSDRSSK